MFSTHIRNAITLAEAPTQGQDIFHYAPKSAGAEAHDNERPDPPQQQVAEPDVQRKDITTRPVKKSPAAPFTTSTLQQEAARKLGFTVAQTMMVAQRLYESGQIT